MTDDGLSDLDRRDLDRHDLKIVEFLNLKQTGMGGRVLAASKRKKFVVDPQPLIPQTKTKGETI